MSSDGHIQGRGQSLAGQAARELPDAAAAAFPLILLGVSVLVFFAIRLVPGDAITAMLGTEAGLLTPQQRDALAAYFGIDQPWPVQYWRWLAGLFQGDLGISVTYGKPVLGSDPRSAFR